MVKPTESKSPHRPLKKESEGLVVGLKATIITVGHTSTLVRIGALDVRIGNANLRDVTGLGDL